MAIEVAIIGFGAYLPAAPNPETFWHQVCNNHQAAQIPPPGRWILPPERAYHPHAKIDRVRSTRACFVSPLASTQRPICRFSAQQQQRFDPVLQIALYTAEQAFTHAKITEEQRHQHSIDVILGHIALPQQQSSDFAEQQILQQERGVTPFQHELESPRTAAVGPAAVIQQGFSLQGAAYTLDAACASSLYALQFACDSLKQRKAKIVLAGGISRPDSLYTQMGFSQLQALSPTGTSSPFDQRANGLLVGEGACFLVLQRLEDALHEQKSIYGIIRGIGLSNDTKGKLLAPDTQGQLRALQAAYQQAGWYPQELDLIECHATGTAVGDSTEFQSLQTLWTQTEHDAPPRTQKCVLSSAKSNVGHLLTAAGAVGCLRTLLAFQHQTLPPTAQFQSPPDTIPLAHSPFQVLTKPQPWHSATKPRKAGVSAFGFGGINAHLLLEEFIPQQYASSTPQYVVHVEQSPSMNTSKQPVAPKNLPIAASKQAPRSSAALSSVTTSSSIQNPASNASSIAIVGICSEIGTIRDPQTILDILFGHRSLKPEDAVCRDVEIPFEMFRIPPKELEALLLQQVWSLRVARQTLQQSHDINACAEKTGVYLGVGLDLHTTNYHLRWAYEQAQYTSPTCQDTSKHHTPPSTQNTLSATQRQIQDALSPPLTADRTMGGLASIAASRIAREYGFGGPCFVLAEEENSGLRACELALNALQAGHIQKALVGAVDLPNDIRARLARQREACPQGHNPRIADAAVGILLKPLTQAQKDGDTIYACLQMSNVHEQNERKTSTPPTQDRNTTTPFPHIGWCGAAQGLLHLAQQAWSIHHQVRPGIPTDSTLESTRQTSTKEEVQLHAPEHWVHDRQEGPRQATVSIQCPASLHESQPCLRSFQLWEHVEYGKIPHQVEPKMTHKHSISKKVPISSWIPSSLPE
ncbi:MAG: beta-ketoacyl synthase N-terminal-like domain-containing protein, partial [Myxococcota bacterium]